MYKLTLILILSAASFSAVAQSYTQRGGITTSRYPVYDRVYEGSREECHDVIVQDNRPNVGGVIVGSVIGYAIGREIDRGTGYRGGYYGHRRHDYYRQPESRVGRYGGAVAGGYIGSQVGSGGSSVQRVCDSNRSYPNYREVLTGYRVVIRYPNGQMDEYFEPAR
ncbi:hypothetical protein Xoosp13_53 [Xanthomonas phage Xoo-sp13]|nr:hypothetical protein Xoosp13_53 [Xanthomonas phage Xoo-sp13]